MTTFYVSPQGNNSNSGTSWSAARQTIASALSSAGSGDQVWVAAGTYQESLTMVSGVALYGGFQGTESSVDQRDLSSASSTTIIDGSGASAVITVPSNASTSTRIDGFTVQHGQRLILCNSGSAPVINGNTLTGQNDSRGYSFSSGAVYCTDASPTITNNLIVNNSSSATMPGMSINAGGVYASGGSPKIVGNTFYQNKVNNMDTVGLPSHGGALYADNSDCTFADNIVANNSVTGLGRQGGGVWVSGGSTALSTNCYWSNSPADIYGASLQPGDLQDDPQFYDPGSGDFELQSTSPCINAGNSTFLPSGDSTDRYGEPRIVDSAMDMGACEYQGTPRVLPIEITPTDGIAPVRITMQGQTPTAYIAYTTDGSAPTSNSTRYDGEFVLEAPATVKAAGFQDGWDPSPTVSVDFSTATVIRVAQWGSDSASGASWDQAKQTLGGAISAAGEATAIWVAAGIYYEKVTVSSSIYILGGFGGWETTIQQRDPVNHRCILDGKGGGTLITFGAGAQANSGVSGMILRNANQGVLCQSGSAPTINGNTIHNLSQNKADWSNWQVGGIVLKSSNALVTSNLIYQLSYKGNPVSSLWAGGISTNSGSPTILGNTIDRVSGSANPNANAVRAAGIVCHNSDAVVANNISTNCNSSYVSGYGSAPGGGIAVSGGTVSVSYNCTYGNSPHAYDGVSAGSGAVEANPLYVSWGSGNYRLQSGSPCLQAGSPAVLPPGRTFDIQGLAREVSGQVDLGAYENQLSNPPVMIQGEGMVPSVLAAEAGPGATIRYTVNGSTPSVTSPVLSVPLMVTQTTDAKLVAFAPDGSMSRVVEARFEPPLATLYVSPGGSDSANGSSWSQAFATVSHALSAAEAGTAIWVAAGTYQEKISVPPQVSLFGGFAGTETSLEQRDWATHTSILDGGGSGTVVNIAADAQSDTVVDGFTIQNGTFGVVAQGPSSPIISHNIIQNHSGSWNGIPNVIQNAGAVQLHGGAPLLANNLITGNSYTNGFTGSGVRAGGVWLASGRPMVVNNTIVGNSLSAPGAVASGALGAGIWISGGEPVLMNNIVADNNATADGGGAVGGISKTGGSATLDYNCVYGNQGSNYAGVSAGAHGISVDPAFADAASGNYQLASGSPCINAGSNGAPALMSLDLLDKPRVVGSSVDMGAYESQS
ncbi:MAG: choice-of-anchor Q domain-containing protein [Acidobacteriota bacterium]|nr:choice-of-anchor Q domain-containing protein [Acidobacteriota bacterium]